MKPRALRRNKSRGQVTEDSRSARRSREQFAQGLVESLYLPHPASATCPLNPEVLSSKRSPPAVLTLSPISFVRLDRHSGASGPAWPGLCWLLALSFLALACGCNRFRIEHHETVYVMARQMYLHDRVAAVSNRVAEVVNGQQLEVLEHGRRFLKVKTQKNEIGWIEDHAVIDAKTFQAFDEMASQHKQDQVVSTAVVSDDIYLHLRPGRDTERFYLLPENSKVQLLARASVPKTAAPGVGASAKTPQAASSAPVTGKAPAVSPAVKPPAPVAATPIAPVPEAPPVVMEDWWLVRDSLGHAGWMLAGRHLDVDVPDEIGIFAEGQRIVSAYVLAKVTDSTVPASDHLVPEYVTVLSPPKSGLPFDFDQVRVFTWSTKRHRYETAFRLHPIQGFLPVRVSMQPTANGSAPIFSFQIANGNVWTDPTTGISRSSSVRTIQYMLVDTQAKRIGADQGPIPVMHTGDSADAKGGKDKKNGKDKKKR